MTTTFRILTAGAVAVSLAIAGWAVASLFEHVSDPPPSGQDAGGATIIDPAAPKAWVTDTFTHEHPVTAVAFGPGVVAAGDNAGVLTLWDVRGGREKETLLGPGNRKVKSIDRVHFSPDGVWLYVVTDDGQSEFQCSVEKKDRYFPAVGGRGQWASYGVTADGAYWLQRISGSNELIVLKNGFGQRVFGGTAAAQFFHSQPIDHVAAGDAQTIVTVSGGVLRRWGLGSATPIWETKLEKIDPAGLAVGPDGKVIAVAGKGGEVQLFSAEAGVRAGKLAGHTGEVCAVAFSGDGKRIATGGADKTARLWDAESFTQLAVLKGHTAAVTAVAFSPAGNRIATGSADRTVKVWEHRMCPWLVADTAE
jgi:WD40 repeat protein